MLALVATPGDAPDGVPAESVARSSLSIAGWTLVSRLTGFARVAVLAAVLGPTYLGNTFQAVNSLPNLIAYQLLMGSLFVSLLVPALVGHIDAGDARGAERLAGAFLGLVTLGFVAVVVVVVVAGPELLRFFTVAVADPSVAAAQRRVGWLLLVLVMPQVLCYGLIGTAIAVQNAHGRFVVAAAAPVLENVGTVLTLLAVAVLHGTGQDVDEVPVAEVLLLGLGATAAVTAHAAAQWLAVRRLGIRLRPRTGWRDPQLRALLHRVGPSLGFAGLDTFRQFAVLVAVNRVPGGVVAFQLAVTLCGFPLALGAQPVGTVLLPQLSRLFRRGAAQAFRDELVRGLGLVHFLVVPAAVGYLVLSQGLASAVSFGEMATPRGVALVVAAVVSLAPGILGAARFHLLYQASYAREDARTPFLSMLLGTAVALLGIPLATLFPAGTAVLVVLGIATSVGQLVSAWDLERRLRGRLPGTGQRQAPALLRAAGASAVMALPAYAVAAVAGGGPGRPVAALLGLAAAGVVGLALYLALQRLWRSPELRSLAGALGGTGRRGSGATEGAATP